MGWQRICRADKVPVGQWWLHRHRDLPLAVVHTESGFFAFEDRCSHDETCLSDGWLDGEEVICPRHAARFSVIDGRPLSPPATIALRVFPVRLRGSAVEVDLP